jgi:OOP family OmpA-OmpF porin
LRDPLATDPAAILRQTPIDPADVTSRWKPYHATRIGFCVIARHPSTRTARHSQLKVENGVLIASGFAPQQWIESARRLARGLPGISHFDGRGLLAAEKQEQLQLKDEVEKSSLRFNQGTSQLASGQEAALQTLIKQVTRLFALAALTNKQPRLDHHRTY